MTSPDVIKQIEAIWLNHNETIFDAHDYMNMAYRLAIVKPEQWDKILEAERGMLQTDDLRNEFDFVSRACNPDKGKRDDLFKSLLKPQNRKQEPWALHTLELLNADVFEPDNIDYISASLKSLEDPEDQRYLHARQLDEDPACPPQEYPGQTGHREVSLFQHEISR